MESVTPAPSPSSPGVLPELLPLQANASAPVDFSAGALVLLDKPEGKSSFWLVRQLRRITGVRTIGHGGTLDPFATGLMVLLVGKSATRQQDRVMHGDKGYRALLRLGVTSDSHDRTGQIDVVCDAATAPFDTARLHEVLAGFRGPQLQVPPMFSAIKQGGERLYRKARRGEDVVRAPRAVTIHRLEVLSWNWPLLELDILCSKGTYIRSLASDLGRELGTGALVQELRRTSSGDFSLDQVLDLDTVERLAGRTPGESPA
ncbi:MAG: tRNA pseudouridine(55) synthase TruB [Calditrichaeota bacterium]|nr:tRNA pseudouridine(55) synthase TruB [Candidatus Cloacimonadota bacterium]MCA9785469.1 tRNA pseudouridine(55) synthase TruB [Candidatus Cloacimonadota bacterium]MCB1046160.1 tRNA pseudouridine(55) synthase TruB [Calditrichota bacterium]MCB9473044.1 tRNA pseudouridine(55) synthase TruB [Candidatus Delongbacteria bacterium]